MKLKKIGKIVIMLIVTLMFVACNNINRDGNKVTDNEGIAESKENKVTLNLWSHYGGLEEVISEFEKENPNIKVNLTVFPYEEYELEYKKSLIKEEGDADLFIIDSNHYGAFNSIEGLENLLEEEYTAINYEGDYDKELWELGKSMDKKELLGLPIASAPIVTYYRADIMDKYGFPSDPKELAEYMKSRENWMKIGKTLSEDGIYTVQWSGDMIRVTTSNMPYFNENLEYQRDNDEFKEAISISREARLSGLSPFTDIWTEKGKALLENDRFAMLYLGSWGARELEERVPEQKGKWRVTSLPFGVNGWNNASILSIAENSKNKEAAWKFIEFYTFKYNDKEKVGSVAGYLPFRNNENNNRKNEFLGGQEEQKFYEETMALTKEYPVTALDDAAFKLWDNVVNKGIDEDLTDEEIMTNIRNEVENTFRKEKEILIRQKEN